MLKITIDILFVLAGLSLIIDWRIRKTERSAQGMAIFLFICLLIILLRTITDIVPG
jgi:tryptophan-rich sensory protein